MRVRLSAVTIVLGLMLGGCSGEEPVTLHKPGIYKGPPDPLIEKQRSTQQQEVLLSRFKQVQTDR